MSDRDFGTIAQLMYDLGDPNNGWSEDDTLVAAGHVLTEWHDNAEVAALYEMLLHGAGAYDEPTLQDLGIDDVLAICKRLWEGVQVGYLPDPRDQRALERLAAELALGEVRTARFNLIVNSLAHRLRDGGLVDASGNMLPDAFVTGYLLCDTAAVYLAQFTDNEAAEQDLEIFRQASLAMIRLFDHVLDEEERHG